MAGKRLMRGGWVSAAILAACAGCASGGGIPVPGFLSGWGKKSAPDLSSQQPAFGSAPLSSAEKSSWQRLTASITDNGLTRGVQRAFGKQPNQIGLSKPRAEPADEISLTRPTKAGPEVYLSVARLHEKREDFDSAAAMYQKALDQDRDQLDALLGLAKIYDRADQFSSAENYYKQATKAHPHSAAAWNDLGVCYARQKKYDAAAKALEHAVDERPEEARYRNNLSKILVEVGRPDEALAHQKAVHNEAVAEYNVAFMLQERKRSDEALIHFRRAVTLNPNFQEAQAWVANLSATPEAATIALRDPAAVGLASEADSVTVERAQEPASETASAPAPRTLAQPAKFRPTSSNSAELSDAVEAVPPVPSATWSVNGTAASAAAPSTPPRTPNIINGRPPFSDGAQRTNSAAVENPLRR